MVDLTNLQRQIMHTTERVGQAKTESGAAGAGRRSIRKSRWSRCSERADGERLAELVARGRPWCSIAATTSPPATRVNRACVRHRVPLVSGAAIRFDGQISVFDPRSGDGALLRLPVSARISSSRKSACATMGVFAPLVGIIGAMQAAEALKLIVGIGPSLAGRLLLLDARSMEWSSIGIARNAACAVCGQP